MDIALQEEHLQELRDKNVPAPLKRTPPHNLEAEMALIGSILANNKGFEKVSEFLQPEHFIDPAHQKVFQVIGNFIEKGQLANPITLANFFERDNQLEEIGGKTYLAQLAAAVNSLMNVADYGKLIYDLYLRRELIDLAEDVANNAFEFDLDKRAINQIEEAEQKLFRLAESGYTEGGFEHLSTAVITAIEVAEAAYKRDSHITGLTTGLRDLDKKLGGLHPSDLIILAGRPAMGKTSLAMKLAFEAAKAYDATLDEQGNPKIGDGGRVAFFSLEMSSEQLAGRLLSEQTKVSSDKIRRGEIKAEDFEKFVEASQVLSALPLYIDDTPGITVSALRNRARRLKRQKGLELIIVDYLQLIQAPGGSSDNRVQAVSEITRGLKMIAKELNVPVIALSQLSRGPEQRDDKRPQLADLRESGSIEQDADAVMFIFREEYYLGREQPPEGTDKHLAWMEKMEKVHNVSEVIVAKHRHGPVGTVKLFFDGAHTTFADLQTDYDGES